MSWVRFDPNNRMRVKTTGEDELKSRVTAVISAVQAYFLKDSANIERLCGMEYQTTKLRCSNKNQFRYSSQRCGSAKNMPLPLPHHSKKHTVTNLLDIIFYSIYLDIVLQCQLHMYAKSHQRALRFA